jgi:hypothetical protein
MLLATGKVINNNQTQSSASVEKGGATVLDVNYEKMSSLSKNDAFMCIFYLPALLPLFFSFVSSVSHG